MSCFNIWTSNTCLEPILLFHHFDTTQKMSEQAKLCTSIDPKISKQQKLVFKNMETKVVSYF